MDDVVKWRLVQCEGKCNGGLDGSRMLAQNLSLKNRVVQRCEVCVQEWRTSRLDVMCVEM